MFFVLSKILWFILAPFNLALILLTGAMLAMALKYHRIARRLGIAAFAILFLFGVLPTGPLLTHYLETRYPLPAAIERPVHGIILLGGAIDTGQGLTHGAPQLKSTADRITTFATLGRQYPWARLVFTGGDGSLTQNEGREGDLIRPVLATIGFTPGKRLRIENASRTTAENAAYTKDLMQPKAGERWLLVTSASHMPRAIGAFNAVGWTVIPYPSDFLTPGRQDFLGNMQLSHVALKEMLGIAAYAGTGSWSKTPVDAK